VVEGMLWCVTQTPRLLHIRNLVHYFDGKLTGLHPTSIIKATPRFVELRGAIDGCVMEDFDNAAVYTQQFDTHRVIFEFGKAWNPSAYSAQKLDLRQYHQDMSKQRDWRQELEKMKIGNVVGTLFVESKTLKHSLVPVTQRTLDHIKNMLLVSAREETVAALGGMQQRVKVLQERPESLDGFMAFITTFTDMNAKKRGALKEAAVVDEMYDLLAAYEVSHSSDSCAPGSGSGGVAAVVESGCCCVLSPLCGVTCGGLRYLLDVVS
jgi:dynein heavy chain, axonemal